MSYEPYLRFPDAAEPAIKRAAREKGYSTTAAYLRRVVLEDVAESTGRSMGELTGVTESDE